MFKLHNSPYFSSYSDSSHLLGRSPEDTRSRLNYTLMTQKVGVGKNDLVLTERVRVGVHNTRILISRVRSNFGHLPILYLPPVQRSLPLDLPQISSTCHKDIIVRRSVGRTAED